MLKEFSACEDKISKLKKTILDSRSKIISKKEKLKILDEKLLELADEEVEEEVLAPNDEEAAKDFKKMLSSITKEHFTPIDNSEKHMNSLFKVRLIYEDSRVNRSVILEFMENETFEDLKQKTSSFWGLPADMINFTSPGNSELIYASNSNIRKELYYWQKFKLKDHIPILYVVLASGMSIEDYYEDIIPSIPVEKHHRESTTLILYNEEEEQIPQKSPIVRNRIRFAIALQIIDAILQLVFTIYWTVLIVEEMNVVDSSYMNTTIQEYYYSNPFDQDSIGILRSNEGDMFDIKNTWKLWNIHADTHSGIHQENRNKDYKGYLTNFIYIYEAIEMRQVRSNERWCEIPDYDDMVLCMSRYSLDPSREDFRGRGEGFRYDKSGRSNMLVGNIDWYGLDGFKVDLPILNYDLWEAKLRYLIANSWVDHQTRAVFISKNIVNPTIGILTVMINMIEIGRHMQYVPSYLIYTINYNTYTGSFMLKRIGIFLMLIILLGLKLRLVFISQDQIDYINNNQFEEEMMGNPKYERKMDKLLQEWDNFYKRPLCKRRRKTSFSEKVTIFILFLTLLLEIASDTYYLTIFQSIDAEDFKYTSLVQLLSVHTMLVDFKLVIMISFLGIVTGTLLKWVKMINELYHTLKQAIISSTLLAIFLYVGQYFFCLFYHYTLGTYLFELSGMNMSFFYTLGFTFGISYFDSNLYKFVSGTNIALSFLMHRVLIYFLILFLSSNFYFVLVSKRQKKLKDFPDKIK